MPESFTFEDAAKPDSFTFEDAKNDEFKRDELAKQTFEARLEGERGKLGGALADAGGNAAYWIADALAKVDPTGISGNILARQEVPRTPPLVPPEAIGNAADALKETLHYPSEVPIFPTEGKLGEISRGLGEGAKEMASGLTDPGVLAGLGLSRFLPHEAARLFQLQSLGGVIPSTQQALQAQNLEEAVKGGSLAAANAAIPISLGGHTEPSTQSVIERTGKSLDLQRGAVPPVGEPAAPIERVTPEQAAATAERMSVPFEGSDVQSAEPKYSPFVYLRELGLSHENAKALIEEKINPKEAVDSTLGINDSGPDRHTEARWLAKTDAINRINEILGKPERYTADELYGKSAQKKELEATDKFYGEPTPTPAVAEVGGQGAKEPWQMTRDEFENGPPVKKGFVRLWRGESTEPNPKPEGLEERWFSTSRESADFFAANVAGGKSHIVYVDIPIKDLEKYDAFTNPEVPESERPPIADEQAYVLPRDIAKTKKHWVDFELHGEEVAKAVDEGKPVPPEVLADYPDLKPTPKVGEAQVGPEMVGMGGALQGEVATGAGTDIYGIAERVRAERAKAGQVAEVPNGQGISAPASVEHGRQLLNSGTDPEAALKHFEETKKLSSDDLAVTRAYGEQLALAARRIEEKFGTTSQEFLIAQKALSEWDARTKPMQTEWHKMGMAQQGETDIDTGSFTGINRAYRKITDRDLNPPQKKTAESIAKGVSEADKAVEATKPVLQKEIDSIGEKVEPHIRRLANKIVAAMDDQAKSALERIRARQAQGRAFSVGDPRDIEDLAIYGAAKITKGVVEFGAWSAEMIADIGEGIKPFLKQAYDMAVKREDEQTTKLAGGGATAEKVKASKTVTKAPKDLNEQKKAFNNYQSGQPMNPDQLKALWTRAKDEYIDNGKDGMADTVYKLGTDFGLPVKDVLRGLNQSRSVKRVADDVWQKQRQARILKQSAKRWIQTAEETWMQKVIPTTARAAFAAKTGLHGTVALGTHAPLVAATNPKIFAENFGKMYKLVASPEYYEMQIRDLKNRDNYDTAQRAGLVNDPSKMEDFNDPKLAQGFPKLAEYFKKKLGPLGKFIGAGTRGYTVLKILRQDLFDKHWDGLAQSEKTPDMARAIADSINHITGVTKTKLPDTANLALFAPKLLYSRIQFAAGDPIRAANSLLKGSNMTPEQKWFAMNQVKEKAKIFAVASSLLLANQQLNNFLGDKKKLNGVPQWAGGAGWNPMASDFMKFRVAGMNVAWGSPFLTMTRLPARLIQIGMGNGGKTRFLVYPDESMYKTVGSYLRTQESPIAAPLVSLLTKADYEDRPLPQIPGYGPPPPVPKRLAAQGVKPYTWPEFILRTTLPIPFEEGAKEIWHYGGLGDTPAKQEALLKAFITTTLMAGTGARISEDWQNKPKP